MKLLIIDDEAELRRTVELTLRLAWPEAVVLGAPDGAQGLLLQEREQPDCVLVDVGLPDLDGFEVCRHIRARSRVPLVMLTVRAAEADIVAGFEAGADDYLTKPFGNLELVARLRALLRRSQAPGLQVFRCRDLEVDFRRWTVIVAGQEVRLSPTEFGLLRCLVEHAGEVRPFAALLQEVWGPEYTDERGYLRVHIHNLKQKLGDHRRQAPLIANERGVGYRFVPDSPERSPQ
ncbi:MAG: response regulator transcription factor [Chloroflexi bacterium]|nr:response regulator transcription factor [Chloroflexota bacterium]